MPEVELARKYSHLGLGVYMWVTRSDGYTISLDIDASYGGYPSSFIIRGMSLNQFKDFIEFLIHSARMAELAMTENILSDPFRSDIT